MSKGTYIFLASSSPGAWFPFPWAEIGNSKMLLGQKRGPKYDGLKNGKEAVRTRDGTKRSTGPKPDHLLQFCGIHLPFQ